MRCYFLRDNHIEAVHFLKPGSDEDLIQQGKVLFEKGARPGAEDFEIWEGTRFVYCSIDRHGAPLLAPTS